MKYLCQGAVALNGQSGSLVAAVAVRDSNVVKCEERCGFVTTYALSSSSSWNSSRNRYTRFPFVMENIFIALAFASDALNVGLN